MPEVDAYFDRFNPDLLALIPPDAKVVLEIGCGAGKLAEMYRRQNPSVEWHGIERDGGARELAESRGITLVAGDLDADDLVYSEPPRLYRKEVDCLVFGDILEHLRDPWFVLEKHCDWWLKPGGIVLASIPNVGHWSVIRDLMSGQFRYADEGLLDRTHLRFFTLDSIRDLFGQAGFPRIEVTAREFMNEEFDEFLWQFSDAVSAEQRAKLRAYQYIVRAVKPSGAVHPVGTISGPPQDIPVKDIHPIHVHAVSFRCPENGTVCERPRIVEPFAALRTIPGFNCTWTPELTIFGMPDVLIQQRFCGLPEDQHRLVSNHVVVAEIDDDPRALGIPPEVYAGCHAVQCSTDAIADVIRPYNPNVVTFQNQLAELPPWEEKRQDGLVSVFFGALNRKSDWEPIMPALNRVIASHDAQGIHFVVVHDREFFDALETPSGFKDFYPFLPYEEYRIVLRSCDIALLPLEDTPFNRCKSDIKFLECAANGVAMLASESGSHGRHRDYAMLYYNPASFALYLNHMIECPSIRRLVAQDAYDYVRDHRMIGQHYRRREAWYRHLVATKPQLHSQLLERCPSLATGCPRSPGKDLVPLAPG